MRVNNIKPKEIHPILPKKCLINQDNKENIDLIARTNEKKSKESMKISPISTRKETKIYENTNQSIIILKTSSNIEGNIIELKEQMINSSKKLTIKNFLTIRSLIKPHKCIKKVCIAFLLIMGSIPKEFKEEEIDWHYIQQLFENPGKFMNLIGGIEEVIEKNDYDNDYIDKIIALIEEENEFFLESSLNISDFVRNTCQYLKIKNNNKSVFEPIENIIPLNISNIINDSITTKTEIKKKNIKKQISHKKNIILKNSPKKEKKLNKLQRILNLKVSKPIAKSFIKEYLNNSVEYLEKVRIKRESSLSIHRKTEKSSTFHLFENKNKVENYNKHNNEREKEIKLLIELKEKEKREKKELSEFRKDSLIAKKIVEKNQLQKNKIENIKETNNEKKMKIKFQEDIKQKKREESKQKYENILFIRENKKKLKDEEKKIY